MCWVNPGSETTGIPTVTAVLFPVNEETPRLVQVEYKVNEVGDEINHDLNLKPWFNTPHAAPYPHWIDRTNGQTGRPLGRTLSMIFNDNFIMSRDPLNQSIERNVSDDDVEPTLRYLRDYGRMRY
ncbi:hypothetical protein C8Q75DRAFT_434506 [Abortiporus biennis]|nr:hypothetical protein C8Q75DRAFT_434506 [Abortiporus biennis]